MYLNYFERWVKVAGERGIDIVFVSVEYRKCPRKTLPT